MSMIRPWLGQNGGAIPFRTDLAGRIVGRIGTTMDAKVGSDATILPAIGNFGATTYCSKSINDWRTNDTSGFIEARVYYDGGLPFKYIFASGDEAYSTRYFRVTISNGTPTISARDAAVAFNNSVSTSNAISVGWHTLRFESTGTEYKIYVDGVEQTLVVSGVNDGKWIGDVGSTTYVRDNISIGVLILNTIIVSGNILIDYVNYNNIHKWVITGVGKYVYDVIGGEHLTWTGSGTVAYDTNASTGLLDGGYSVWTMDAQPNEIVPYYNGAPVNVASFLTGYVKSHDCIGRLNAHNLAPSMIEVPGTNFNRSSVTIFGAAARAGADYNATYPNRWLPQDLADPRIYYAWRLVGYRGMIASKILNTGSVFYAIQEILSYTTDKTGNDQFKIMKYCKSDDFAVTSGGLPVLDGDNYVVLI